MGNWWLSTSSWQCARSCIRSHEEFFWETSNHPGDLACLQPRFGALWLLAFPKTKITFEREEISDCWWDSGKYDRAADGNWENCVRSQGAYFEGDWAIIVICTMFLVSYSITVPIFHSLWLDTFWTDLKYPACFPGHPAFSTPPLLRSGNLVKSNCAHFIPAWHSAQYLTPVPC